MFTPEQSILALECLFDALESSLNVLCEFNNQSASALHFDYDPTQFNRSQKLRLLRANFNLQLALEQLSSIIEYTPYIFRLKKVNEYG